MRLALFIIDAAFLVCILFLLYITYQKGRNDKGKGKGK